MRTIITIIILTLIISCSNPVSPTHDYSDTELIETKKETVYPSISDTRMIGIFKYSKYWTASDGIDEINEILIVTFNGTTRFNYYHKYKNYTASSGWVTSPDFGSRGYDFDFEIEINSIKTKYRYRSLYETTFGEFKGYYFTNDTLVISNLVGSTEILIKQ